MIPIDLLAKGFEFVSDKGLDWVKTICGELDKRRLIHYGEQKVENENFEKLDKLCAGGLSVRRDIERRLREEGFPAQDKYLRSNGNDG